MTPEEILSTFSADLREFFDKSKEKSKDLGGVMSPLHLAYFLLDTEKIRVKDKSSAMSKVYTAIANGVKINRVDTVKIPPETKVLFESAVNLARGRQASVTSIYDLVEAALKLQTVKDLIGNEVIADETAKVRDAEVPQIPQEVMQMGTNLTKQALEPNQLPFIGRQSEIQCILETLSRKLKNNPLLVGRAGVGKTALVRNVAKKLWSDTVPPIIRRKVIVEVDRTKLMAGAKYQGMLEERLKMVVDYAKANRQVVLFFDEIHSIMSAGLEGTGDVANLLKAALGNGEITIIGATTTEEYHKFMSKDDALLRRFNPILLQEPTPEQALAIVNGIKADFEKFHNLKITDEAISRIIELAQYFIPSRAFPDKAIDLLDRSSAKAASRSMTDLALPVIEETVGEMTGLPGTIISKDPIALYNGLATFLKENVIGQDEAIEQVSNIIKLCKLRLDPRPERPDGVFIFTGPPGVGKKWLALMLAKYVYGSESKLIPFEMSEYTEDHYISRLIGSPPGYIGYGERGALVKAVEDHPHSVLLFKNLEAAHPVIVKYILEALRTGTFASATGRTHSVSNNTVVLLVPAACLSDVTRVKIGFRKADEKPMTERKKVNFPSELAEIESVIDDVIVFNRLGQKELYEIARRFMDFHCARLLHSRGLKIEYDKKILELAVQFAESKQLGHSIHAYLSNNVLAKLTNILISNDKVGGITVTANGTEIALQAK